MNWKEAESEAVAHAMATGIAWKVKREQGEWKYEVRLPVRVLSVKSEQPKGQLDEYSST